MTEDLDIIRTVIAWALILGGSFFLIVSAIGMNRMPDIFTRLHAASVGETLGAGLILTGLIVVEGFTLVALRLAFLLVLLWFIGPFATHAVARAAMQAGNRPLLADRAATPADATKPEGEVASSKP